MTGINTPGHQHTNSSGDCYGIFCENSHSVTPALDPRDIAAQGSLAARRGIEPGCRRKNVFEQAHHFLLLEQIAIKKFPQLLLQLKGIFLIFNPCWLTGCLLS